MNIAIILQISKSLKRFPLINKGANLPQLQAHNFSGSDSQAGRRGRDLPPESSQSTHQLLKCRPGQTQKDAGSAAPTPATPVELDLPTSSLSFLPQPLKPIPPNSFRPCVNRNRHLPFSYPTIFIANSIHNQLFFHPTNGSHCKCVPSLVLIWGLLAQPIDCP